MAGVSIAPRLLLVGAVLGWLGPVGAREAETAPRPLPIADQSPTAAVHGLPRATGYTVVASGEWRAGLRLDYTSHYTEQSAPAETLLFDGETTRAALVFRRGFADRWQATIEIPFVAHSGGFADSFIDDFHDTFGFADGGRARAPRDRQRFRYARDGRLALDVDDSPSGVGDLRLGLKRRLAGVGDWGAAIAGELKLPTGDAERLTGSGGTDLAVWATIGNNQHGTSRWRLLAGAGGLHTGRGDVLDDQRVDNVAFGWASIGYALSPAWVAQAQVNLHGALYEDTGLEALDGTAVQGALGLDWQVTAASRLTLGLVEDLNTGASPDVSLSLGLEHAF